MFLCVSNYGKLNTLCVLRVHCIWHNIVNTVYKYTIYFRNICTFSSEILKCISADLARIYIHEKNTFEKKNGSVLKLSKLSFYKTNRKKVYLL